MKPTERQQFTQIREQFFTGRAIFLLGPRDGGKQAFLNALLQEVSQRAELSADNVLMLNGEDPDQRSRARSLSAKKLLEQRPLLKVLCFLEVQRFPEIVTLTREILAAHPDLQLLFLSSSRNDTVVRLQEACAGRRATFHVLPPAMAEHPSDLHQSILYGRYPSALEDPASASLHLQQILRQTIQKEVLHSGEIRKPDVLDELLVLLARNLGNELIIRDLSLALDLDPKTILRYIGLLEKAFLVFRVPSYFGFLENEVTASRKLYFYDNGIRNAIMGAYQPVTVRPDAPALWENFLVSERLKQLNVQRERVGVHYWRSTQRQEVSYLEKREEGISAWQFNWEGKKTVRFPKTFTKNYGPVAQEEVRPDNFHDFLGIAPLERVAPSTEEKQEPVIKESLRFRGLPKITDTGTGSEASLSEQASIPQSSQYSVREQNFAAAPDRESRQTQVSPAPDQNKSLVRSNDIPDSTNDSSAVDASTEDTAPADKASGEGMSKSMFRNVLADLRKKPGK